MIVVDFLVLIIVKMIIGLMSVLPWPLAMYISRACILLLKLCMPRATSVSMRNLELVFPKLSKPEREELVKESFKTLAGNLVSYAKIPQLEINNFSQFTDVEKLSEQLKNMREKHPDTAILFPTAHLNYFEMFVQMCIMIDRPIAILARGFGLPRVDEWWNRRREVHGCEIFGRQGGFKETVSRLNAGQDVCMLFDQNVKKNHAVFVDFFGVKAATTKTVALAAIRTGAPVYFLTSYKDENHQFNIFLKEIPAADSFGSSIEEQVEGITNALHRALEEVIRLSPGQWFWLHRRFKTRPKGEAENTYEGC